jgi:hypothetical protein
MQWQPETFFFSNMNLLAPIRQKKTWDDPGWPRAYCNTTHPPDPKAIHSGLQVAWRSGAHAHFFFQIGGQPWSKWGISLMRATRPSWFEKRAISSINIKVTFIGSLNIAISSHYNENREAKDFFIADVDADTAGEWCCILLHSHSFIGDSQTFVG